MDRHKLLTNARRHGALLTALGNVAVQWWRNSKSGSVTQWEGSGGPIVSLPFKHGFGNSWFPGQIEHEIDERNFSEFKENDVYREIRTTHTTLP